MFGLLDPQQSTYPFDWSYEGNFFLLGGIPALVGLVLGALGHWLGGLMARERRERPSASASGAIPGGG